MVLKIQFIGGSHMKRESILDRLIEKYANNVLLEKLIETVLFYYEIDSFRNSIPHYDIVKALYCDDERLPYWKIGRNNFLHSDTIKKYVREHYDVIVKGMIEADYIAGIKMLFGEITTVKKSW